MLRGIPHIHIANWTDPPCYEWDNSRTCDWAIFDSYPRCSMYGIFTYKTGSFLWVNVGKYSVHGITWSRDLEGNSTSNSLEPGKR